MGGAVGNAVTMCEMIKCGECPTLNLESKGFYKQCIDCLPYLYQEPAYLPGTGAEGTPRLHGPLGVESGAQRIIDTDEETPEMWFENIKPFKYLLDKQIANAIDLLQRKILAKADAGNIMAELKKLHSKKASDKPSGNKKG